MKYFKVLFENNIPTSAQRLYDVVTGDIISISQKDNERVIQWLIVYAENEKDAIEEAAELLKKYYAFFGLSGSKEQ